jgi:hypothetical protein
MSDTIYKVSRSTIYHEDRECPALDAATHTINELDREMIETWELTPCKNCVTPVNRSETYNHWREMVDELRGRK